MFMPVEPAWLEILRRSPATLEYGYARNVVLVSHSTLIPVLRTVANVWRIDRSNKEAQAVAASAGELFNAVCTVAERVEALGRSLGATGNHYNRVVTALVGQQGLHSKVEDFKTLSTRASKTLGEPQPLPSELDDGRLRHVLQAARDPDESE